jgi:hypothetical protein
MATTTVTYSPNTYAGELYGDLITPSIIPAQGLVDKGLVTPLPGIKKRTVLRTLDFAVEFQNPSCDFVGQAGTIAPGEKYIDPVKYEVMVEVCYADLRTSWEAAQLKKGSFNDYVPPKNFEDLLLQVMQTKIGLMNEQLYIRGKAGVTAGTVSFSAAYPGLIARMVADSTVNKYTTGSIGASSTMTGTAITMANPGVATVASTANLRTGDRITITANTGATLVGGTTIVGQTFTITVLSATTFSLGAQTTGAASTGFTMSYFNVSSALDILTFAYNMFPEAVRIKPDFKIWIPTQMERAYSIAQAQVANGAGSYFLGKKELDFLGEKLETVEALPANTIIGAAASNVFLGFDDSGDEDYIRITDMAKTTGDDKYRYKASMKTDINYVFGNEMFLIAPVIS